MAGIFEKPNSDLWAFNAQESLLLTIYPFWPADLALWQLLPFHRQSGTKCGCWLLPHFSTTEDRIFRTRKQSHSVGCKFSHLDKSHFYSRLLEAPTLTQNYQFALFCSHTHTPKMVHIALITVHPYLEEMVLKRVPQHPLPNMLIHLCS